VSGALVREPAERREGVFGRPVLVAVEDEGDHLHHPVLVGVEIPSGIVSALGDEVGHQILAVLDVCRDDGSECRIGVHASSLK
jgi:hypothetical protein